MKRQHSRKQFAKAALTLLEKYPRKQAIAVLAQEIVRQRWTRQVTPLIADIGQELFDREGSLAADVVSASKISVSAQRTIADLLKQATGAQHVELLVQQQPDLLGGLVVRTADLELDMSARAKLRRLTQNART